MEKQSVETVVSKTSKTLTKKQLKQLESKQLREEKYKIVDNYILAKLIEGKDSFDKISILVGKKNIVGKSRDRLKVKGKINSFDTKTRVGKSTFPESTKNWYNSIDLLELTNECRKVFGLPPLSKGDVVDIQTELDFESVEDTTGTIETKHSFDTVTIKVDRNRVAYSLDYSRILKYTSLN